MKALMACFTLVVCLGGILLLGQTKIIAMDNQLIWTVEEPPDSNEPSDPNDPDEEPPVEYVCAVEEPDPNAPEDPNEEPMGEE